VVVLSSPPLSRRTAFGISTPPFGLTMSHATA
jgi:hypothetical protein